VSTWFGKIMMIQQVTHHKMKVKKQTCVSWTDMSHHQAKYVLCHQNTRMITINCCMNLKN